MDRDRNPFRRGFTLIELLVVIAIISLISSLVVPSLLRGRTEAQKLQCQHNLKQIYTFAMVYSDQNGGSFPLAKGSEPRAHESLNELFKVNAKHLVPAIFICPASDAAAAEADGDGEVRLTEDSVSYAWTARRLKNTSELKPLASDKYIDGYEDSEGEHAGHPDGMNVLRTDGSALFVNASALDPETKLPPGLTR